MKSKRIIGLATLFLALSVVGCGGGKKDADCKHSWKDDATVTQVGDQVAKNATCTEKGLKGQKCSKCGATQMKEVAALGHDMQNVEGGTPATCTEAGTQNRKCSRCDVTDTQPVDALGHEWGETVWTTEATCEHPGAGNRTCSRCQATEPVTAEQLEHDIQLIGDETEPEPGKAKVRVYTCANGCGQTYLGFKANEVTDASKEHLTIGADGGASFWGRPIGNAVQLDETGSASESSHEAVFDKNEQGDYFEYKFDLTNEQAASLATCKLHCDAKPSNYMGQNGVDFWKVKGDAASDWTYGMYIDDDPAHVNADGTGKIIEDFRYVLYVDGQLKQMDYSIDTPVPNGDPRGDYVLPFTFSLHAGENTIKLVMAGGYRSTFYNFTFRAA